MNYMYGRKIAKKIKKSKRKNVELFIFNGLAEGIAFAARLIEGKNDNS